MSNLILSSGYYYPKYIQFLNVTQPKRLRIPNEQHTMNNPQSVPQTNPPYPNIPQNFHLRPIQGWIGSTQLPIGKYFPPPYQSLPLPNLDQSPEFLRRNEIPQQNGITQNRQKKKSTGNCRSKAAGSRKTQARICRLLISQPRKSLFRAFRADHWLVALHRDAQRSVLGEYHDTLTINQNVYI
ncbi:hypothetical protein B0O99DRAFT_310861 [Bisporella sp. PMI_857]|nr:hypothetical protein B0O99DRAFT_310861 [Bisporella sp. PMI_857]